MPDIVTAPDPPEFDLPGLRLVTALNVGPHDALLRAKTLEGDAVLARLFRGAPRDIRLLARARRTFDLCLRVGSDCAPQPLRILRGETGAVLLLRDPGGAVPTAAMPSTGLALDRLVDVALHMAQALQQLHGARILHTDLRPDTLLVVSDGTIRLADLGQASRLVAGNVPEVTRASDVTPYSAPERCRDLTQRLGFASDLYSLGAIFFELASGRPPFEATDPGQLAHAHIARSPPDLRELRGDIPPALAEIVRQLLEKNSTDRYASAVGLVSDLETCRRQFRRTGTVRAFPLRQRDVPGHFTIPARVYGREKPAEAVVSLLAGTPRGMSVSLTIAGPSGIGKSAFMFQMRDPLAQRNIRVVSGKFDQFRHDIPYSAFFSPSRRLLRDGLARSPEKVARLKETLSHRLYPNGRVLSDLLPELELAIGQQPEIEDLPPPEAANRNHFVIAQFLGTFAEDVYRLIYFIDDAQWADHASLDLIATLSSMPGLSNVTFVLGFRSNRVGRGHPLRSLIEKLQSRAEQHLAIELPVLGTADIHRMIADTLYRDGVDVTILSERIQSAAQGNPFYAREYLTALYERDVISYDPERAFWQIDLERLTEATLPARLAEHLRERLIQLPAETTDLLVTASCLGSRFDLLSLARVHQMRQSQVAAQLGPALDMGLIFAEDQASAMFEALAAFDLPETDDDSLGTATYSFQHDQVRSCVHEHSSEDLRAQRRLTIVRLMLKTLGTTQARQRATEFFGHIVGTGHLLKDPQERLLLAELGLHAGQSYYRQLAFQSSRTLLETAIELLPKDAWVAHKALATDLHMVLASCCAAQSDHTACERLCAWLLSHIEHPVERARVQSIRQRYLMAEKRFSDSVDVMIEGADTLGVSLSRNPGRARVLVAIMVEMLRECRSDPRSYASLPATADRQIIEVMRILAQSASTAYFVTPNLLPLIGVICTRLSLRHGLTQSSAYGFAVWGLILSGSLGWIDRGCAFADLALELSERDGGLDGMRARSVAIIFVKHWKLPYREVTDLLADNWQRCRDAGDEESAVYSGGALLYTDFLGGGALDTLQRYPDIVDYIARSTHDHSKHSFLAWAQLFDGLAARSLPPDLSGDRFDLKARLADFERDGNFVQTAMSLIPAAILDVLAGRHGRAEQRFAQVAKVEDGLVGQSLLSGYLFFRAFNAFRVKSGTPQAATACRMVPSALRRLRRWSRFAPANQQHRVLLLEAEQLIARGDHERAVAKAYSALEVAGAAAPLYQALALDRLGAALDACGLPQEAENAGRRAGRRFALWGASALAGGAGTSPVPPTAVASLVETLDLKGLIDAISAISGGDDFDSLTERTMTTLLQLSNASRGLLILTTLNKGHRVAVEIDVCGEVIRPDMPLDTFDNVLLALPEKALRHSEAQISNDAQNDGALVGAPHLIKSGVQSAVSVPLIAAGQTVGAIYLENALSTGAFPPGRIAMIEALASQTAIALENLRLYSQVRTALDDQIRQAEANRRFVPDQILAALGEQSIVDVKLDAAAERRMHVVFVDLRSFTKLAQDAGPKGTIRIINRYLAHIQPGIAANGGFVGNYLGDGLIALFPGEADDALNGAIAMARGLRGYNEERGDLPTLDFGIGIQSGEVILGMIGEEDHIQSGILGDAVNTAARIEALTGRYCARMLLGADTVDALQNPERFALRRIGPIVLRGRRAPLVLYDSLDIHMPDQRQVLLDARDAFEYAAGLSERGAHIEARAAWDAYARRVPDDPLASYLSSKSRE